MISRTRSDSSAATISQVQLPALLVLLGLVILTGCLAAPATDDGSVEEDELGVVHGYTPTDTFEFEDSQELTEEQLEAVTYRTMARIEVIRGLAFTEDVDVEVLSRETFREQNARTTEPAGTFENELWRGSFVVDGQTDVNEALDTLYGDAVLGYYSAGTVVLVVENPDMARIDRDTLVHELVHALQDQHFGLDRQGTTIDERRGELGLIEGEANYIPHRYDQHCGDEWVCLDSVDREPGEPSDRPFNVGLFLSVFAPYSEGPVFVQHLHETSGWEAVDDAFENRPASTEQLIHPERYPDVRPVTVSVPDRSNADWEPITTDDGEVRTETIGEATLFATLFANGVVDRSLVEGSTELSPYNYSYPATDGWAGDTMVIYTDGDPGDHGESTDHTRMGHVWTLQWHSESDATQFQEAYVELLKIRGAERVGTDTYRIPDDRSFAGAYRLSRDGTELTIVGGPTVESLSAIHQNQSVSVDSPIDVEFGPRSPVGTESTAVSVHGES